MRTFERSGIDRAELLAYRSQVCPAEAPSMTFAEFATVMHMITGRLRRWAPPATADLPAEIVQSIRRLPEPIVLLQSSSRASSGCVSPSSCQGGDVAPLGSMWSPAAGAPRSRDSFAVASRPSRVGQGADAPRFGVDSRDDGALAQTHLQAILRADRMAVQRIRDESTAAERELDAVRRDLKEGLRRLSTERERISEMKDVESRFHRQLLDQRQRLRELRSVKVPQVVDSRQRLSLLASAEEMLLDELRCDAARLEAVVGGLKREVAELNEHRQSLEEDSHRESDLLERERRLLHEVRSLLLRGRGGGAHAQSELASNPRRPSRPVFREGV